MARKKGNETMSNFDEKIKSQKAVFQTNSIKEYVKMSDGAELLIFRNKKLDKRFNIIFLSGYAAVIEAWNDFLDSLMEDYNLYVPETREKPSSKVKFKHKGDVNRLAMDINDIICNYNLNEKKTFIIASSSASMFSARAIAKRLINPAGIVFLSPILQAVTSKKLILLTYIFPSWIMNLIFKGIIKIWIKTVLPDRVQYDTYKHYIDSLTASRAKKTRSLAYWDSTEDFKKIECSSWIFGDKDVSFHPKNDCHLINELIPNSKYIQVPYFGYMHFLPDAKKFAEQIEEFIKQII